MLQPASAPPGENDCLRGAVLACCPQVMGGLIFTNLTRQIEIGANCYCLDLAGKRIVLDSGLHPRFDGAAALPDFSHLPDGTADAIVLSHAHQDHVGSMPVLMRRQPQAPVFMTEATRLLSDVMLHNSVNVMMKKREEGVTEYPLFTHREVDIAFKRWRPIPLRTRFDVTGERLLPGEDAELSLEFFDAGHILGSVGTLIRAQGRQIFYTGDVQFDDQTIMQGAQFPEEELDVLIIETTRGDRATPQGFTREGEELRFAQAIKTAFELAPSDQRVKDILKADSEYAYRFLHSLISKAIKEGKISKEEDPELLADYFISTWTGWHESYILHKDPVKIKKMGQYFIKLISR